MAARFALPCSGFVWAFCAISPGTGARLAHPPRTVRRCTPGCFILPVFPIFACEFTFLPSSPHFADFCPFRAAAGGGGGAASKVCSFFYFLQRRAGERRGGALKVIAYTLYAMSNSPPCVMPSGMALLLRPARFARSRWEKTCVRSSCSSASDNFSLRFFGLSAFAPVLVRIFG
nr:MAG TPA: hypothetical protein [Caudoviricetes sp.]